MHFPEAQTCCGQPAFNAGAYPEARRMAKHTLTALEATDGPVVVPSGSCAAMLRHGYLELFRDDPDWLARARALADRTYEFSQFLVEVLGVTDLGARFEGRLAYHPTCHLLRGLGVREAPLRLLEAVEGAQVQRLSEDCCGFGGLFSVELPEVSGAMMARKLDETSHLNVDALVACDVSCLMHLEGGLRARGSPLRCAHLAQVLAGGEPGLR